MAVSCEGTLNKLASEGLTARSSRSIRNVHPHRWPGNPHRNGLSDGLYLSLKGDTLRRNGLKNGDEDRK
jgi:hypothetical protein